MKVVVDAIAHPQVASEKFSNMDHYINKHNVINSKTTAGVGGGGGGWVGSQFDPPPFCFSKNISSQERESETLKISFKFLISFRKYEDFLVQ